MPLHIILGERNRASNNCNCWQEKKKRNLIIATAQHFNGTHLPIYHVPLNRCPSHMCCPRLGILCKSSAIRWRRWRLAKWQCRTNTHPPTCLKRYTKQDTLSRGTPPPLSAVPWSFFLPVHFMPSFISSFFFFALCKFVQLFSMRMGTKRQPPHGYNYCCWFCCQLWARGSPQSTQLPFPFLPCHAQIPRFPQPLAQNVASGRQPTRA